MDELLQEIRTLRAQLEAAMTRIAELRHDGTMPTNSHAERSIRKAVLWRKMSLGADSEGCCRFVERMLTVAGAARKRGIDLLDWLTRALQARIEPLPAPAFRG